MAARMLVVWCPDWPVIAAGYQSDDSVAVMFASRVVACSRKARQYGVKRGLKQREAQSRCADIVLLSRNPSQEALAFEAVLESVEQVAVGVEVIRPGVCAFLTKGPSKYFGGDVALSARIRAVVERAGFDCHVGIADGLFAATCAARRNLIIDPAGSGEYLAPLPVSTLEQPKLTDLLVRLGLKTLGDFAQLDPKDVLGRFGNAGSSAHCLARGEDSHAIQGRHLAEDFVVQNQIDPPIQQVDQASFVAKRTADELVEHLTKQALACRLVRVDIETEHGESRQRSWRHEIGFNGPSIAERVRWQLTGWLSALDESSRPSAGVSLLRLVPLEVVPDDGRQKEFWGGESEADVRAMRAIDRVRGLLGADAVQKAVLSGGRNVNESFQLVAWGDDPSSALDTKPWPGRMPAPSPAIIHKPPLAANLVASDGTVVMINKRGMLKRQPTHLEMDGEWLQIDNWAGPWLFDERWWDPAASRRRACFQLTTLEGKAVLAAFENGTWFVEATFD